MEWLAGLSALYLITLILIYFIPTVIAFARGHQSAVAVLVLNLLLGWTFLGWVIALVWSFAGQAPQPENTSIEARKSGSSDNIRSRASGDAHVAVPVATKGDYFDGDCNMENARYQLFLADKYEIRKNETFGKFVVSAGEGGFFESLELALSAADKIERAKAAEERQTAQRRLEDLEVGKVVVINGVRIEKLRDRYGWLSKQAPGTIVYFGDRNYLTVDEVLTEFVFKRTSI